MIMGPEQLVNKKITAKFSARTSGTSKCFVTTSRALAPSTRVFILGGAHVVTVYLKSTPLHPTIVAMACECYHFVSEYPFCMCAW